MSLTINKSARILMAAATAVLTVGALAGCSVIDSITGATTGTETRDEEGTVTEGGQADVFQIKVGDCFNDEGTSESEEISDVPVVPCSEPHDNEIFFDFELTGDTFPLVTLEDDILAKCGPAFKEFIGVDFNDSVIEMSYIAPTSQTWTQMDDRLVSCFVIDPDGQTTGSLKGAAR
ncbi:septum formation family protein [Klugiella xanthotipulae]|uniref:Regulator of septum formation n=1 Tax=Klugiella xanthotipulae TaxID=244735 RepID=A0A543I5Z6_9MICO|nr:hypothetical protein [Klugiella xanthotipulae]TQM65999.1 hypothetical protein FB466_0820 [Klugiella xanthotipulae]